MTPEEIDALERLGKKAVFEGLDLKERHRLMVLVAAAVKVLRSRRSK